MAEHPYSPAPLFPSSDPLPLDSDEVEFKGNSRKQRGQRFKWSPRLEHVIARLKAKRPNHSAKGRLQCFKEEVDSYNAEQENDENRIPKSQLVGLDLDRLNRKYIKVAVLAEGPAGTAAPLPGGSRLANGPCEGSEGRLGGGLLGQGLGLPRADSSGSISPAPRPGGPRSAQPTAGPSFAQEPVVSSPAVGMGVAAPGAGPAAIAATAAAAATHRAKRGRDAIGVAVEEGEGEGELPRARPAALEAQAGYAARCSTKTTFLKRPHKIIKNEPLVNVAAVVITPQGKVCVETSGRYFGAVKVRDKVAEAVAQIYAEALVSAAKGELYGSGEGSSAAAAPSSYAAKQPPKKGGGVFPYYVKQNYGKLVDVLTRELSGSLSSVLQPQLGVSAGQSLPPLPAPGGMGGSLSFAQQPGVGASAGPPGAGAGGMAGSLSFAQQPGVGASAGPSGAGAGGMAGSLNFAQQPGVGASAGPSLLPVPALGGMAGSLSFAQQPADTGLLASAVPSTADELALEYAMAAIGGEGHGAIRAADVASTGPSAPPTAVLLDPGLAWLPTHLAPLESEIAKLRPAVENGASIEVRLHLAAALRSDPRELARLGQLRVWARGSRLLLVEGRLENPLHACVTPDHLKEWIRTFYPHINLCNTWNKYTLVGKVVAQLAVDTKVENIRTLGEAVIQRIAVLKGMAVTAVEQKRARAATAAAAATTQSQ